MISSDVGGRVPRLRERFADQADALLVTRLVNIRYLTGFSGSAGLLLVLPDELVFVTDGRYKDQSAEQLRAAGVEARPVLHGGIPDWEENGGTTVEFHRCGDR